MLNVWQNFIFDFKTQLDCLNNYFPGRGAQNVYIKLSMTSFISKDINNVNSNAADSYILPSMILTCEVIVHDNNKRRRINLSSSNSVLYNIYQ